MHRAVFAVAFVASLLGGCDLGSRCERQGPITGSAADFHTKPGDYAGYSVAAPVPCGQLSMIVVTGRGTTPVTMPRSDLLCRRADGGMTDCAFTLFGWIPLDSSAEDVGGPLDGGFGAVCPDPRAWVWISDWTKADAVVATVGRALADRDLAFEVAVVVGYHHNGCITVA